jgi:superfamily II DNA or RNA helicase
MLTQEGVKAKSVTGETFSNDRRQAVQDFSDGNLEVLINFNIFSTGFDDPTIDCVIIARPTFSVVLYSQMVGRGLRGPRNGGTENCLLINVIDNIVNLPDIENACNFFDREWEN